MKTSLWLWLWNRKVGMTSLLAVLLTTYGKELSIEAAALATLVLIMAFTADMWLRDTKLEKEAEAANG